jgi:hypothetical protein
MLADMELDDMLESSLTGVEGLEWNQGRFKNYDLTRLLLPMNAFLFILQTICDRYCLRRVMKLSQTFLQVSWLS